MATVWAWALWIMKQLGLAGCAIGALLIFFLGLPWIGGLPFIGHVPLIGDIATGYVERERREAADDATKDMVDAVKLTTARTRIVQLEKEASIAKAAAEAAERQRELASKAAANAIAELERRINEDHDPDDSVWTEHDIGRLRH